MDYLFIYLLSFQGMTPEIKARMEANKMKALQKREARLGIPVEQLSKYSQK